MFMAAFGMIRMIGTPGANAPEAQPDSIIGKLASAIWRRISEEWRYRAALREVGRLDDRDLDDLAIGRADFPALVWRHVKAA